MSANTRKPAASSRTERATAKSSRHSSRNTPAISHASDTGSLSSSPPANPATRRTNTSVSVTTSSDCRSKRSLKTLPHARSVNTIPIPAHPYMAVLDGLRLQWIINPSIDVVSAAGRFADLILLNRADGTISANSQ